ncbi:hypothetical protein J7L02_02705 [Candidatus Woesearchaeota archaeon]|nr:hypothetical protein [Candidatus Woesearchaeota archaeon]
MSPISEILMWLLTTIFVIVILVKYFRSKKIYPLLYIASIYMFIMFSIYLIDIYHTSKLIVTITLILSGLVILGVGMYLKHVKT